MADQQTADQASAQRAQEAQKAYEERKEQAKKKVADDRQAREQRIAETTSAAEGAKPTPTQEENDLAALGVHVPEKEPDGSPEQDPNTLYVDPLKRTKQMEAGKRTTGQQYQTRAQTPRSET